MKQSLEKQPIKIAGRNTKTPDYTGESIPAAFFLDSGKSQGNPVVGLATSNGTINLSEGTNKNELWV
ncbi:hypothetical protein [Nostoc sp. 'Peltigera malacea cyanobiont' DB3992]|uniref:hypothetical protein n=1 Tax=Nostoc sp. 'Peltigera malacea cyanobiont' DB3992 TaxID=1206980 RepID=UPI000C0563FB|nr:hypothetical protein [Nostoc sp. 'Peltigera malacea cyanobiont' DB3992]PHM11115.1 hypothetical protein CK516_04340 [Nostoc sp. 'Peltigera malacea cyanobiont' DB3992]